MNHEQICAAWVAHNMGATTVVVSAKHRSKSGETTIRVRSEAKASRISYRGDTIYSFHWWPFARFVKNDRGKSAIIYRDETCSSSTSKHQSELRRALARVPHIPVFSIPGDPCLDHAANMKALIASINEFFEKAVRARQQAPNLVCAANLKHEELEAYAQFFGCGIPLWANPFENDPARIRAFEAKLTKLSLQTGIVIHKFWRSE